MKSESGKSALNPSGHYSQAIIHNDLIYVSAQLAIDLDTGEKQFGKIEDEAERVLKNIELILKDAGSDRNRIIRTTAYITNISLWDDLNEVYRKFFGSHKPARTVIAVKELHFGFKVGIEAIASVV